jgi:hypothetical protein
VTAYELIQWLGFGALIASAGCVAWCLVALYRLRREAQAEAQRPLLSVVCEPRNSKTVLPVVHVVNFGHGAALNIVADDIVLGDTSVLLGQSIVHLEPGEHAQAPWIRMTPGDPLSALASDNAPTTATEILMNTVTVTLTYSSVTGLRYRTMLVVENGIAEIFSDERVRRRRGVVLSTNARTTKNAAR